jgi:hypothetical protein
LKHAIHGENRQGLSFFAMARYLSSPHSIEAFMTKLEDLSFPISYAQIFQEIGRLQGMDTTHFLSSQLAITPRAYCF